MLTSLGLFSCPLEQWLPVELMQNIARENNLSETAFIVPEGNDFRIRWFTPSVEVDLCGHATLASGHVYFRHRQFPGSEIRFHSRSGLLRVRRQDDLLTLDFPSDPVTRIELSPELTAGFNIKPKEGYRGKTDFMLVYENESQIVDLVPDFRAIARVDARGVIVTSKGRSVDFVSRFFGPQSGVDEDPVTGSAHTTLTTYWSNALGRTELTALQLSSRRGSLQCKYLGDRVEISGKATTYLVGEIDV